MYSLSATKMYSTLNWHDGRNKAKGARLYSSKKRYLTIRQGASQDHQGLQGSMEPMHACHSSLLKRPIFEFHCVAAGVINVFLNLLGAPLIIIPYGASIYPFMQLYSQGPAHQSAFPKGRSLHLVSWSVPTLFWEPTGSVSGQIFLPNGARWPWSF